MLENLGVGLQLVGVAGLIDTKPFLKLNEYFILSAILKTNLKQLLHLKYTAEKEKCMNGQSVFVKIYAKFHLFSLEICYVAILCFLGGSYAIVQQFPH